MGNSPLRNGSASAGVGCKSYLCGPTCGESRAKHEKYTSDFEEKSKKTSPLEDPEISSSEEEDDDLEHLIVQELGVSLSKLLHVHDNLEPLSVGNPALYQDENSNHEDTQHLLLDTATLDGLNENAIVPHFSVAQPYPSTPDVIDELPCDMIHEDNFAVETPASACSLPAKKLISALKGSREKQGKHPSTKLSVKWAPEVYDPPITSSSRTVKGRYRHHGVSGKKYTKGKTSRVSGKKYARRRSSSSRLIDSQILRLQEPGAGNKQEWNLRDGSKMEPSVYASAWRSPGNVTICGSSSCYVESITPIPLPVAQ